MSKEKYLNREDYSLKIYLNKLQNFSEVEVKLDQLTSIEMTNLISNFDFSKYYSFNVENISFDLVKSEYFKFFIESLFHNSELIFFIIDGARKFGAFKIKNINFFNFNFNFNDDNNGVLIFIDSKFSSYVLIDLYEENGKKLFDIEIKTIDILHKNISNKLEKIKLIDG